MPRPLAPCGTWSAYRRHKRLGEPVDEACRVAARDHSREQREREQPRAAAVRELRAAAREPEKAVTVSQLVAYGNYEDVAVPTFDSDLDAAVWLEWQVTAALMVARPADKAPLAKAVQEARTEVARLRAIAGEGKKVSALDRIAQQRAKRLANAAG